MKLSFSDTTFAFQFSPFLLSPDLIITFLVLVWMEFIGWTFQNFLSFQNDRHFFLRTKQNLLWTVQLESSSIKEILVLSSQINWKFDSSGYNFPFFGKSKFAPCPLDSGLLGTKSHLIELYQSFFQTNHEVSPCSYFFLGLSHSCLTLKHKS